MSDCIDRVRGATGRVLEMGTLRWGPASSCVAHEWCPHAVIVRTDVAPGDDVDVVADAHDLAPFADGEFDVVIARSVWEHLARPWVATAAVARVLRQHGLFYVSTHQTFPLHGYPHDYFRFSKEALEVLFHDAGFETVVTEYGIPCRIDHLGAVEPRDWNDMAPSWLSVSGVGRKW